MFHQYPAPDDQWGYLLCINSNVSPLSKNASSLALRALNVSLDLSSMERFADSMFSIVSKYLSGFLEASNSQASHLKTSPYRLCSLILWLVRQFWVSSFSSHCSHLNLSWVTSLMTCFSITAGFSKESSVIGITTFFWRYFCFLV